METTFAISLVGTLLWLSGLWVTTRSLQVGMALQLASTSMFAVLNIHVGAYPGVLGAVVAAFLMLRVIRHQARGI